MIGIGIQPSKLYKTYKLLLDGEQIFSRQPCCWSHDFNFLHNPIVYCVTRLLWLCLLEEDHFYLLFYHLSQSQKCNSILMFWYFHLDIKHILQIRWSIFFKWSLLDVTSDTSRLSKAFHRELSIILSHVSVTSNDRWVVIVKWSVPCTLSRYRTACFTTETA